MSEVPGPESIAEIEEQIQETRADLAQSIDELTDRLNPSTQLHTAVEQGQAAARTAMERAQSATEGHEREVAIAAGVVLFLLLVLRRRRRRRR